MEHVRGNIRPELPEDVGKGVPPKGIGNWLRESARRQEGQHQPQNRTQEPPPGGSLESRVFGRQAPGVYPRRTSRKTILSSEHMSPRVG